MEELNGSIDLFIRMLGLSAGIAFSGIIWWICTPAIVRLCNRLRIKMHASPLTPWRVSILRRIGPGLIIVAIVYMAITLLLL